MKARRIWLRSKNYTISSVSKYIYFENKKVTLFNNNKLTSLSCFLLRSLHIEERILLFYLILVENESFRVYILSRTDPETLVRNIKWKRRNKKKRRILTLFIILHIVYSNTQDDIWIHWKSINKLLSGVYFDDYTFDLQPRWCQQWNYSKSGKQIRKKVGGGKHRSVVIDLTSFFFFYWTRWFTTLLGSQNDLCWNQYLWVGLLFLCW